MSTSWTTRYGRHSDGDAQRFGPRNGGASACDRAQLSEPEAEDFRPVAADVLERLDAAWAELAAGVGPDLVHRRRAVAAAAVGAVAREGVQGVGDEDDPGGDVSS